MPQWILWFLIAVGGGILTIILGRLTDGVPGF